MYDTEEKCMELAEKLKKICEAKGSTPYKLAKEAGISLTDFLEEREVMEQYAKEEEELVKVYRSLSGEKRKQLGTYVKMLEEYSGRIDD